jgi:hypothetical protein
MSSLKIAASAAYEHFAAVKSTLEQVLEDPELFARKRKFATKKWGAYGSLVHQAQKGVNTLRDEPETSHVKSAAREAVAGVARLAMIGRGDPTFPGDRVLMKAAIDRFKETTVLLNVVSSIGSRKAAQSRLLSLVSMPSENRTLQHRLEMRAIMYKLPDSIRVVPPPISGSNNLYVDLGWEPGSGLENALAEIRLDLEHVDPKRAQARLLNLIDSPAKAMNTKTLGEVHRLVQRVPALRGNEDLQVIDDAVHLGDELANEVVYRDHTMAALVRMKRMLDPEPISSSELIESVLERSPHLATEEQLRELALLKEASDNWSSDVEQAGAVVGSEWYALLLDERLQPNASSTELAEIVTRGHVSNTASAVRFLSSPDYSHPVESLAKEMWLTVAEARPKAVTQDSLEQIATVLDRHVADQGHVDVGLDTTDKLLRHVRRLTGSVAKNETAEPARTIAESIKTTMTRNLKRLNGELEDGFDHFPDYGEIGEATISMRLLSTLLKTNDAGAIGQSPRSSVVTW